MKLSTFITTFEKTLEVKKGTFKENKELSKISAWDSLAILTFLSLVNKKLKMNVNLEKLAKCKTVSDLGKILKLKN